MVPSNWDAKGIEMLREACYQAKIVYRNVGGLSSGDELRVMTEAQAASLHCAVDVRRASIKEGQSFLVCDAGGGTVDIAVHKVIVFDARQSYLVLIELGYWSSVYDRHRRSFHPNWR